MKELKNPLLAVDGIVLTKDGKIVLVRRLNEPFKGYWALPGGFVEYGERVEEALKREVLEETGLKVRILKLVGVYSDPNRDPRGHVISICYLCEEVGGKLRPSSDAMEAAAFAKERLRKLKLAFDHSHMLRDAGLL